MNIKRISNELLEPPQTLFNSIYFDLKILTSRKFSISLEDLSRYERAVQQLTLNGIADMFQQVSYLYNEYFSIFDKWNIKSNIVGISDFKGSISVSHLIDPPPLRVDKVKFHYGENRFVPVDKFSLYLDNFAVTEAPIRMIYKSDSMTINDEQIQTIIASGKHKMFETQFRPRSLDPGQILLHAVFTYRCDDCCKVDCDLENFRLCKCYLKSVSIATAVRLTRGINIPFVYRGDFVRVEKSRFFEKISSLTPTMFTVLLELSRNVGTETINCAFEGHVTKLWVEWSKTSLFGMMMGSKDMFAAASEEILYNTDLVAFKVNESNILTDISKRGFVRAPDPNKCEILFQNGYNRSDFSSRFSDYEGRKLHSMVQVLSGVPAVIQAPVILGLRYSGQGTAGSGPTNFMSPVKKISIGNDMVEVDFKYSDIVVQRVVDKIHSNIMNSAPNLDSIESRFIESSTSNSAGLSHEHQKILKENMRNTYKHWTDRELKELESVVNVRVIDVINAITTSFTSVETFNAALYNPQIAGERHQVARRPRIIQMVPTVHMLGTFVNLCVLDPAVKNSSFTMSGKTANDIRDMNEILMGTGLGVKCDSADVAGMDTSTYVPQRRITGLAVAQYLRGLRDKKIPYFLNKSNRLSELVTVQTATLEESTGEWVEGTEDISVLEYVQLAELAPISVSSKIRDGYFQDWTHTSTTVFQSGRYDTSVQHSALLSAILEVTAEDLKYHFNDRVTLKAKVLGDDQHSYLRFNDGIVDDSISDFATEMILDRLKLFGYETVSNNSHFVGELLKLLAICGAPSPFHSRLATYSSERGDDYTRDVFARMKDMDSIHKQLSGRVANPDHCSVRSFYTCFLLGYLKAYNQISPPTILLEKGIKYEQPKQFDRKQDGNKISWCYNHINGSTVKVMLYLFKGLWYMAPKFALPPIPLLELDNRFNCYSSSYHFNSPCKLRYLYELHKDPNKYLDATTDNLPSRQDFFKAYTDKLNSNHVYARKLARAYGVQLASSMYSMAYVHLKCDIKDTIDTTRLDFLGINDIYNIETMMAKRPEYISKATMPYLTTYIKMTNRYLDPVKVSSSISANLQLIRRYGISVGDSLGYWNRMAHRITQAIGKVHEISEISLAQVATVIKLFESEQPLNDKFIFLLGYGDYTIVSEEKLGSDSRLVDIYNFGYGAAVPPKSLQSILINTFGLPELHSQSLHAIKDTITKELMVTGVQNEVFTLAAKIYNDHKGDGDAGIATFCRALGLSERASKDILNAVRNYGSDFFTMPYTIDPTQFFFVSTNFKHDTVTAIKFMQRSILSHRLQFAILYAELVTFPHLLRTTNSIKLGPFAVRRFVKI